jgi:hypothetical protein
MSHEHVTSREYKMMLREHLFAGDERQRVKTAGTCWREVAHQIAPVVLDSDGDLAEVKHRRLITSYDTDTRLFHHPDPIFRERLHPARGVREVTLKFRHPDRYLAQDRQTQAREAGTKNRHADASQRAIKLEEDIKPPSVSLYSSSTTYTLPEEQTFQTMHDLARVYPNLSDHLDPYRADEALHRVGSSVREAVITGGRFQISKTSRRDAVCASILWDDPHGDEY